MTEPDKSEKMREFSLARTISKVNKHHSEIAEAEGKHVILCMGRTQAGKSTLYNFLTHGLLDLGDVEVEDPETHEKKTVKRYRPVKIRDGFPVAGSGDNLFSCTKYPHAYKLPNVPGKGEFVFLDTRGFFDNKQALGPSTEAASAILTDMAVRNALSVRIIWLQSYDIFSSSGVSGIDEIGDVFSKIIYDGAPVVFLYNKEVNLNKQNSTKEERALAHDINDHSVGEPEDDWDEFQTMTLNKIVSVVNEVIKQSDSSRKKMFEKAQKSGNESSLENADSSFGARMKFLSHFDDSNHEKRVLYTNPTFQKSLLAVQTAIFESTPAIGEGSKGGAEKKVLNFTNYCKALDSFKKDFFAKLDEFTDILKGRNMIRRFPVNEDMLKQEGEELEKHEKALYDVQHEKDIEKYEVDYNTGSAVSQNKKEQEAIIKEKSRLEKEIENLKAETFTEDRSFEETSSFGTPKCVFKFNDEEYVVEETCFWLRGYTKLGNVICNDGKRFEAEFYADAGGASGAWDAAKKLHFTSLKDRPTVLGKIHQVYKYVTTPLIGASFVGACIGQFFGSRTCKGIVYFKISGAVRNKKRIESLQRECDVQDNNLYKKQMELEVTQGYRKLEDKVQGKIDTTKEHIKKLGWLKEFEESVEHFLSGNVTEEGQSKTLQEVISGYLPIAQDFFGEEHGTVKDFLKELRGEGEQEASGKMDVTTVFRNAVKCAEKVKKYDGSLDRLFDEGVDLEKKYEKKRSEKK